jgi:hypothetical protein
VVCRERLRLRLRLRLHLRLRWRLRLRRVLRATVNCLSQVEENHVLGSLALGPHLLLTLIFAGLPSTQA